jgi:hypothetical protein
LGTGSTEGEHHMKRKVKIKTMFLQFKEHRRYQTATSSWGKGMEQVSPQSPRKEVTLLVL